MPHEGAADALTLGGLASAARFDGDGLLPCVCQDAASGRVLMVAWMDADARAQTLATRQATFWSRSRQERWVKGATSGNVLDVVWARLDCDGDTLLLGVEPRGPACHTGATSCFGEDAGGVLSRLAAILPARHEADVQASYTARLLNGPRDAVARKVGEEATEVLLGAAGSDELVGEVADLIFHALLLLAYDGVDVEAPLRVLAARHRG